MSSPPQPFDIRPALPHDLDAFVQLATAHHRGDADSMPSRFERDIADRDRLLLVATIAEHIAGYGLVLRTPERRPTRRRPARVPPRRRARRLASPPPRHRRSAHASEDGMGLRARRRGLVLRERAERRLARPPREARLRGGDPRLLVPRRRLRRRSRCPRTRSTPRPVSDDAPRSPAVPNGPSQPHPHVQ